MSGARHPSEQDLANFDADHGGVVALHIVRIEQVVGMLLDAAMGDDMSVRLLKACEDVLGHPRQLCMFCERMTPKEPGVICVLLPKRDDPSHALAFTLCNQHSKLDGQEIAQLTTVKLGGARVLPQGHLDVVGRA